MSTDEPLEDMVLRIPLEREVISMTEHGPELIEGVLFFTVTQYDADGKLMRKTLTRGDFVRG